MTLSRFDLDRFNRAVLAIHATPTIVQFSTNLLHAVRLIVDGDIAVVDARGIEGMRNATAYDPFGAIRSQINAAVHRHLHENPLYLRRCGRAHSISDLLPRRAWHRTALYGEAYGRLGQEDGLALDIPFARGGVLTLNMTRSRRGFRSGERLGLQCLEPHVRACSQRLGAQERLRDRLVEVPADVAVNRLSEREREVLTWVANGFGNREVANLLGIRPATVKRHLENLYAKLGVAGRSEARARLLRSPA